VTCLLCNIRGSQSVTHGGHRKFLPHFKQADEFREFLKKFMYLESMFGRISG